jgi:hypothetical protein
VAENDREIPAELQGRPLDEVVRRLFEVSWGQARGWVETGKIWVDGRAIRPRRLCHHARCTTEQGGRKEQFLHA